jgi:hypothetical protein
VSLAHAAPENWGKVSKSDSEIYQQESSVYLCNDLSLLYYDGFALSSPCFMKNKLICE